MVGVLLKEKDIKELRWRGDDLKNDFEVKQFEVHIVLIYSNRK